MKTVKTYKGLTGKRLLDMIGDTIEPVEIAGINVILTPRIMEFSGQYDIASNDDADYVMVEEQFSDEPIIVRV